MESGNELKWFATRMIRERRYVLQYLKAFGIEFIRVPNFPTLLFVHCDRNTVNQLRIAQYDRMLLYKNAIRTEVEEVPEITLNRFVLFAPFYGKPVIYLPLMDDSFFKGACYRVTSGEFKGFEGTIKRVKGSKRLIIRVSDRSAFATPFIPASMLERVGETSLDK